MPSRFETSKFEAYNGLAAAVANDLHEYDTKLAELKAYAIKQADLAYGMAREPMKW